MNARSIRTASAIAAGAALVMLIAACGGGTEGSGDATPDPANITSTGAMAVGSVIVNGIRFDDSNATVLDDRNRTRTSPARGAGEIKDGMTVRVRGRTDDSATGRADLVKIVNEVRGTISAVGSTTPPSFIVAGITVYYDPANVVLQPAGATFTEGVTRVEVHGARDATGNLRATRIEVVGTGDGLDEVRGVIASVSGTFVALRAAGTNPALTIDVSGVGSNYLPSGSSAANLVADALIEVRGTLTGNTFAATTVVFENADDDSRLLNGRSSDDRGTEVEGFVSGFTDATLEFRVGTRRVIVNSSTRYELGSALDLANDVKVEAEGRIDATGLLTATKISFRQARTMLVGPAQDVSIVGGVGSFTIFGKTVQVDNLTAVEDPIVAGQRYEVRGRASGPTSMVAERVRLNTSGGSNPRGEIQAVVTAKGTTPSASVTVLGSVCDISAAGLQLLDGSAPADVAAWLNAITLNRTVVKVKGAISDSTCVAEEAEVEN